MFRSSIRALIFLLCGFAAISAPAQTVYDGKLAPDRFSAGVGFSNFSLDWGPGRRMDGITAWADWKPEIHARLLQHLGVEVEGREIDFGRPADLPDMRQETLLAGATYRLPGRGRLRPYAKFLMGIGGIYFYSGTPYDHDTRPVFAPGGGVDYRVGHGFSVRADYEYQFWHAIFGPHDLNPNGVTVGAIYSF